MAPSWALAILGIVIPAITTIAITAICTIIILVVIFVSAAARALSSLSSLAGLNMRTQVSTRSSITTPATMAEQKKTMGTTMLLVLRTSPRKRYPSTDSNTATNAVNGSQNLPLTVEETLLN